MNDDAGTGRWMTYDELAAMRGIKRIGAVRLVQRYKWRRQAGNDGRARVLVPHDALTKVRGSDAGSDAGQDDADTDAGNAAGIAQRVLLAGALAALEDAVTTLREQLDVANARAERAEADRADDRLRADQRVTDLQRDLDAARAGAQAAQDAAEAVRQEDRARKARGRWARLRDAWHSE